MTAFIFSSCYICMTWYHPSLTYLRNLNNILEINPCFTKYIFFCINVLANSTPRVAKAYVKDSFANPVCKRRSKKQVNTRVNNMIWLFVAIFGCNYLSRLMYVGWRRACWQYVSPHENFPNQTWTELGKKLQTCTHYYQALHTFSDDTHSDKGLKNR